MNSSNQKTDQTQGASPTIPSFKEMLASGLIYRHITSLLALAGVITLGIGLIMWASKPDYVPVFDRLSNQDTQKIAESLRASGIPYQIENGSGLILAPADQLQQARMQLAAEGLSSRDGVGVEMLQQEQSLGTSRFVENARYHHALETELSRTIGNMRNIDSARLHLALPKQSVFIRERAKPSASVMIKLMPGRSLEGSQVTSIVQLIASSVPHLEASLVTVVDQWGKLLSSGSNDNGMDLAGKQFDYARKLETVYAKRIEELLTPILGLGSVRAKVSADVDFTLQEKTQEQFDPGEGKVRSEQTEEQSSKGTLAAIGIPGALSNQPPEAGTTDKNKKADADQAEEPTSVSTQAIRNFELDKTITHSRSSTGTLRKLSVAVLVDHKVSTNEAGEEARNAHSEEEITALTNIVKGAIGFNQQRGDTVTVFNQAFQPVEQFEAVEGPAFYEQPWVWSMAKQILVGIAILFLVIFLARPAMKNFKPQKSDEKNTDTDEENESNNGLAPDQVTLSYDKSGAPQLMAPPQAYGDVLNVARGLAHEDPKRVAKVIKTWVEENV